MGCQRGEDSKRFLGCTLEFDTSHKEPYSLELRNAFSLETVCLSLCVFVYIIFWRPPPMLSGPNSILGLF